MPHVDDPGDELDAQVGDEVLVLALGVLRDQADGRRARVDDRVLDGSVFDVEDVSLVRCYEEHRTDILAGLSFFSGCMTLVFTTSHTFCSLPGRS